MIRTHPIHEDAVPARSPKRQRVTLVEKLKRRFYGQLETPQRRYRRIVQEECEGARSVLDIGCGYAAPDLERLGSNAHTKIGVDLVTEFRPEHAPSVTFVRADVGRLPFSDSSFDLAMSKSVLEHLRAPETVFTEVARVLRPGGKFVFLTPNWYDYVSLFASVIPNRWHPQIVRLLTGRDEDDTFPTLYRANTTHRIHQLCRQVGLEVESLCLLRADPHYLKATSLTYTAGILYEQSAQRVVPQLRPWILGVFRKPETSDS